MSESSEGEITFIDKSGKKIVISSGSTGTINQSKVNEAVRQTGDGGQKNIGKNPEDVVAKEKRQDWKPKEPPKNGE